MSDSDFTITPLNPTEIVEYISAEFTPYCKMSVEEGKKHVADLIQRYADWYKMQNVHPNDAFTVTGMAEFIPDQDLPLTKQQSVV